MVTDPIGDMITRLKNAGMVGKESVSLPFSQFKFAVAQKLADIGFVGGVEKRGKKVRKTIDVALKYEGGKPRISRVKRISRPGRRVYRGVTDIHPVRYGKGAVILSTPQGVMTGEEARKAKVGGEALFEIH